MASEYAKSVVKKAKVWYYKMLAQESGVASECSGCGFIDPHDGLQEQSDSGLMQSTACPFCGSLAWQAVE